VGSGDRCDEDDADDAWVKMMGVRPGRPRQFRFQLSDHEWEKLIDLTDAEDTSAAEVVRALIHRPHAEIYEKKPSDWLAAAETLAELSAQLRALVRRSQRGLPQK
jgi:hypothetical protein